MKITRKQTNRKGFTLVELLVVIAIIASLAGLSYGPIMKHLGTADRTEAVSNGKMIHSALMGFMSQNDNSFPNDDTASSGTATSTTSAAYFTQLFEGGHITEEKYFFHKAGKKMGLCTKVPNNDEILTADECVWGYVEGLDPGDSSSPILFDSSKDGLNFLTNTWKGKAVILKVSGECKSHQIELPTTGLDTTDATQAGLVKVKHKGTDKSIMLTIPAHGTKKTP